MSGNVNSDFDLDHLESYKTLPKPDNPFIGDYVCNNIPIEIPIETSLYNNITININISKLNLNNNYPIKFNINII